MVQAGPKERLAIDRTALGGGLCWLNRGRSSVGLEAVHRDPYQPLAYLEEESLGLL